MGTNRRKAVKERIKRIKAEKKKFAKKVADRLIGRSRSIGIDPAVDGKDSTGTWTWKYHNSVTGKST